jgi:glycosyltransferase involved in cell wall biosynthesis
MQASKVMSPLRHARRGQSRRSALCDAPDRPAREQADVSSEPALANGDGGAVELWVLDDARIFGGGQRFAVKLALGASVRKPVIRCLMVCPAESELARRSRDAGFDVLHADYPSVSPPSARSPAAILALRRLLASAPPFAIFVANSPRTQAYTAAARLLLRDTHPIVNVAHEQDTASRPVARATLKRSGPLVAIGANSAAAYRRALPGVTVRHINNILDDVELESASRAPARTVRLAVLARMIPEKGILELLDEAAASSDHWSTLAIGAPPQDVGYEARVIQRIRELGLADRAHLAGAISDVADFIDEADVLVVPSTGREGQPSTIIEALARGLPVLVREPILSDDFGGLPVHSYHDAGDFGAALGALRLAPSVEDMRARFGTDQAIDGLLAAAGLGGRHPIGGLDSGS